MTPLVTNHLHIAQPNDQHEVRAIAATLPIRLEYLGAKASLGGAPQARKTKMYRGSEHERVHAIKRLPDDRHQGYRATLG